MNHDGLLLERIYGQNKAVLKAVGDLRQQVMQFPTMQQDIAELKTDIKVIKSVVTDLSQSLNTLEGGRHDWSGTRA